MLFPPDQPIPITYAYCCRVWPVIPGLHGLCGLCGTQPTLIPNAPLEYVNQPTAARQPYEAVAVPVLSDAAALAVSPGTC